MTLETYCSDTLSEQSLIFHRQNPKTKECYVFFFTRINFVLFCARAKRQCQHTGGIIERERNATNKMVFIQPTGFLFFSPRTMWYWLWSLSAGVSMYDGVRLSPARFTNPTFKPFDTNHATAAATVEVQFIVHTKLYRCVFFSFRFSVHHFTNPKIVVQGGFFPQKKKRRNKFLAGTAQAV